MSRLSSLILVALIGCSSSSSTSAPSMPAAASARGVFEGTVVDDDTGAKLVGATITLEGVPRSRSDFVSISDEQGHFQNDVPPGVWDVVLYYGEESLELGSFSVEVGKVTHAKLRVPHAVIVAAQESEAREREKYECPSATAGDARERAALVAAVLLRFAQAETKFADRGALPQSGPLSITLGSNIDPRALPAIGQPLIVRTHGDLQAEADRRDVTLHFLELYKAAPHGDCAIVKIGTGMVTPTRKNLTHLCCCTEHQKWEKRDGVWEFRLLAGTSCA